MDMLNVVMDKHEEEIDMLKSGLGINKDDDSELKQLKGMLQECQDKLDEETHKLNSLK
mgnify:CR=1 FL=1